MLAIAAGRTHARRKIRVGIEAAAQRVVDDAVLDTVERIAFGHDRVGEEFELAQAVEAAVAIRIVSEISGKPVAKYTLQQPDMMRR